MANIETTLILIKPDAVARGLIGKILSRFENKGYRITDMKVIDATKELLEQHYAEHLNKPWYSLIESSMTMGPIVALVLQGNNVITSCRKMLGSAKPEDAEPGTIRFDMASHVGRNICHASDSKEAAEKEINLWFPDRLNLLLNVFPGDELIIRG